MEELYPNILKNLSRKSISVILLNGRQQTMSYDKTTKLSSLFVQTCSFCKLENVSIFGFAILMNDYYAFLNLDTKICKINFKEIYRNFENNNLSQKSTEESRKLFHDKKKPSENNTLSQSTYSTKSAPVHSSPDSFISDKSGVPILYFRIKLYVVPHLLTDEVTKHLYFLQLLTNVLEYKLKCVDEIYLQLGSLAIQAFYGDYSSILASFCNDHISMTSSSTEQSEYSNPQTLEKHPHGSFQKFQTGRYFDVKKFFPSWIITKYSTEYLFKEIPQLHKGLLGMNHEEAQLSFIRMASNQYSNFNMHLFPLRDRTVFRSRSKIVKVLSAHKTSNNSSLKLCSNKLWIGLSPTGLEMHQTKNRDYLEHINTLKWLDIDKVTHKMSHVNIHVGCRTLRLKTDKKIQAHHLFYLTRYMHMYKTQSRLSESFLGDILENSEECQKYREKYIYMDLEDLKLHGLLESQKMHNLDSTIISTTHSFKKPLVQNTSDTDFTDIIPQSSLSEHIRESQSTSQSSNYTSMIYKESKFTEIIKIARRDYLDGNSENAESYQNTVDTGRSDDNESESKSAQVIFINDTVLYMDLGQDALNDSGSSQNIRSPESGSLSSNLSLQQFSEVLTSNTCKGQSISFDNTGDVSKSLTKTSKLSKTEMKECCSSLGGMRSWKSEVLFHIDTSLTDMVSTIPYENEPSYFASYENFTYLSSTESDQDFDNAYTSSISSFDVNDDRYTLIHLGRPVKINSALF